MKIAWEDMTPRQRRRRKKALMRQSVLALAVLVVAGGLGLGAWALIRQEPSESQQPDDALQAQLPVQVTEPEPPEPEIVEPEPEPVVGLAQSNEDTAHLSDSVGSEFALLINADTNTVIAEKGCDLAIYPASMTKVLTLLTAAEMIDDPQAEFTVTQGLIDPHYKRGATITGYRAGDVCTLMDLFYGAALRSSADATSALAIAAGGTEEQFIQMMNDKCAQLQLSSNAHFTNTSGLFAGDHTCSLLDMAAIMRAAMNNELCAKVMSTDLYVTPPTPAEADGLTFQNKYLSWFLEKQPEGFTVTACKNGYVQQAQNCLVSYGVNEAGEHYICVTAKGHNAETMMGDHRMLYSTYAK